MSKKHYQKHYKQKGGSNYHNKHSNKAAIKYVYMTIFAIIFNLGFNMIWIAYAIGSLPQFIIGIVLSALCFILAIVKWVVSKRRYNSRYDYDSYY